MTCGTATDTLHNTWINLRSAVNENDPHAIPDVAERGEDYLYAAYEKALDRAYGFPVYTTISQHSVKAKASHDRIRVLRDSFAE